MPEKSSTTQKNSSADCSCQVHIAIESSNDMSAVDELLLEAVEVFQRKFHADPEIAVFAPGRANLIGEHTDYNDGFVLPFALPYKTVIVASKTTALESTIFSSAMIDQPAIFKVHKSLSKGQPEWANYVKGVVYQYLDEIPGANDNGKGAQLNAVIACNVPIGSGLSSSAAIEVATVTMLEKMFTLPSDGVKKALRCQKAEHTFAGMPCGIMDQYISALGQAGNLLLIDCRSNNATLVPFGLGENVPVIVVTNSNVKHQLTGSEYPDRVKQCKQAVEVLKIKYPQVNALRDATMEMLEVVKKSLSEVSYRRARHVIGENTRTLATVDALKRKDYTTVGKLMTASHESLRHDYEVSCEELDFLVETSLTQPGVFGSRITGGGFGGCSVTLVSPDKVDGLVKALEIAYEKRYGGKMKCSCYVAQPSPGAGSMDLAPALTEANKNKRSPWLYSMVPFAVLALAAAVGYSFYLHRTK